MTEADPHQRLADRYLPRDKLGDGRALALRSAQCRANSRHEFTDAEGPRGDPAGLRADLQNILDGQSLPGDRITAIEGARSRHEPRCRRGIPAAIEFRP
jgi:hypothetical protein